MHAGATTIFRPDYERPPVVETVLGVQFDRLASLSNAHFGLFWKTLNRQKWPQLEDATPLPNQLERFVEAARWGAGIQVQLTDDPASRCRIKNCSSDRMIQLQNTRLHLNWLGDEGGEYPRHETMLTEFEETFRLLSNFAVEEKVGVLKPNQWEITYVNHIPQGTVWQTPDDWHFFRLLGTGLSTSMVRAETFQGEWHLLIPENRGRLHIQWQHAKKSPTDVEAGGLIRLVFTARGPLEQSDDSCAAIIAGLNLGRDAIVTSFRDFASKEANDYWGLKHGN